MPYSNAVHSDSLGLTSQQTRAVVGPCPIIITSSFTEQRLCLTHGHCVVGSSPQADFVLQEKTVSRRHLSLQLVPEGVHVIDLQSTNGTTCDGRVISERVFSTNTELVLGRTIIEVNFALCQGNAVEQRTSYGVLRAGSASMHAIYSRLARLEGSLLGVLLSGEAGTDLELVARTIHQHSRVCLGPWTSVNCAALNHEALQRELFGSRDVGLSATDVRAGAFARADAGTLFLDEISELPLDLQTTLLRALHERDLSALRGKPGAHSSARVIAATHQDLTDLVRRGRFRRDLYRRLSVVDLQLPTDASVVTVPRRLDATLPLHGVLATEVGC
jgi:two-component system, NtrC family, nitrogen regulation response regulator GlnG